MKYFPCPLCSKYYKTGTRHSCKSDKSVIIERQQAVELVMDLFYALREIKSNPTLKDLVKLAKRIKNS
jgi:hypothetical protein